MRMLCVPERFCPLSSAKSYDSAPACWIATQPSGWPPSPGFFDSKPGLTSATGAAIAANDSHASANATARTTSVPVGDAAQARRRAELRVLGEQPPGVARRRRLPRRAPLRELGVVDVELDE